MKRAGIYVRISKDRKGDLLGVARQEHDCRALAADLGWAVVDIYVDDDLSAYNGKRRPAYERLLDNIRSRTIDAVVAMHPDRLSRDLEDFTGGRVGEQTQSDEAAHDRVAKGPS